MISCVQFAQRASKAKLRDYMSLRALACEWHGQTCEVLIRRSIGEMFASGAVAMYLACDASFAEKDADLRSQAGYTMSFGPLCDSGFASGDYQKYAL
eukprot:4400567-Amphidinium_carterae.1